MVIMIEGGDAMSEKETNIIKNFIKKVTETAKPIDESRRLWKREVEPIRRLTLWGRNTSGDPSFLFLYGQQKFERQESDEDYRPRNILASDVIYTHYLIAEGSKGHFPSFEALKYVPASDYAYSSEEEKVPQLYYKKGFKEVGYWASKAAYAVEGFLPLPKDGGISIPYYEHFAYEDYVGLLKDADVRIENFTLAKHPNEVIQLPDMFKDLSESFVKLLGHDRLDIRKKSLCHILGSTPPKEIFSYLCTLGSGELASGLFLELAKKKDPVCQHYATGILEGLYEWESPSYHKGLQRCANIYLTSLDEEKRSQRIKWMREHIANLDLHLIALDGKPIPNPSSLDGKKYRTYANKERLKDVQDRYEYDGSRWKRKTYIPEQRYEIGAFTDGVKLDMVLMKNVIQEAVIYGVPDLIGQLAYYLDAPRVTYYLQGNTKTKAHKYYLRYLRQALQELATEQPKIYIEALVILFSNYKKGDYVCKFTGNFQFNYFIRNILYKDFDWNPPIGWDNWQERDSYMSEDQLLKLEGRYEAHKDLWDNALDQVLDIALNCEVPTIIKAFYYILKDSPNQEAFINGLDFKKLLKLSTSPYEPLAKLFFGQLKTRLDRSDEFNIHYFIDLLGVGLPVVDLLALEYLNKVNGLFKAHEVARLLFIKDLEKWHHLIIHWLNSFNTDTYEAFVSHILKDITDFATLETLEPEILKDTLLSTTKQLTTMALPKRMALTSDILQILLYYPSLPTWIMDFFESLLLSGSYEDLATIMDEMETLQLIEALPPRQYQLVKLLLGVKGEQLPEDHQILDILATGSSQVIQLMCQLLQAHKDQLKNRVATVLVLLECQVDLLQQYGREAFEDMETSLREKCHGVLIDSPVPWAYQYGLEKLDAYYGDNIPSHFLLQLLEHPAADVKAFVSTKMDAVFDHLDQDQDALFMYYAKTVLFMPNKVAVTKERIYNLLPTFIRLYPQHGSAMEALLLQIGGSNIIKDAERSLVALAQLRKETSTHATSL